MSRWLISALLSVMIAFPGPAPAQQQDIRAVIDAQIDAFLSDDMATAFSYASPAIRGLFGTPENFGLMVRRGYPMVWRPAEVTYLGVEPRGPIQVQTVRILDAEGRRHTLEYHMIDTPDGWQINGVVLLRAPDVGV